MPNLSQHKRPKTSSSWFDVIKAVDSFEDVDINKNLIDKLEQENKNKFANKTLNLHVPSIKSFSSSEISACNPNAWPAVSITGPDCELQCDHCQANVLTPMLSAKTPELLWRQAQSAVLSGATGMLISGGSNRQNEVEFGPFLETIRKIKDRYPKLLLSCHTGLIKEDSAVALAQAGIDCAMIDIIGAQDTIRQVYHLRKNVDDFESSLHALTSTIMKVVPHIVIGLHYGKLLGEWNALEIILRYSVSAIVLVVAMPHFAAKHRPFLQPQTNSVGQFIADVTKANHIANINFKTDIILGCARPPGVAKQLIDIYALCAGIDGIAYPADGIVELAAKLGKPTQVYASCCSIVAETAIVNRKIAVA